MAPGQPEVIVDARPEAVRFSPATTAVIVVDMQNDFTTAGGVFERAGSTSARFEGPPLRRRACSPPPVTQA